MAEDSQDEGAATDAANAGDRPQIQITQQYVKDLSFESPNAPATLAPGQTRPQIEVNFDVQARPLESNVYEISLRITADATNVESSAKMFVAEVVYCGLFTLRNIPAEHVHPTCLIECPRLLFPFARRVMADLTRDGGFPPLMLDPIDFGELYRHHARQQQADAEGAAAAGKPDTGGGA
jgi:preprotein translocase subunit SecB